MHSLVHSLRDLLDLVFGYLILEPTFISDQILIDLINEPNFP